jgi:hypothetical protein
MRFRSGQALVDLFAESPAERRRISIMPMGGAYNRVEPSATAFAHRGARYSPP